MNRHRQCDPWIRTFPNMDDKEASASSEKRQTIGQTLEVTRTSTGSGLSR